MDFVYYLVCCWGCFLLFAIKMYYMRIAFKSKYPILKEIQTNTKINIKEEIVLWLEASIVVTTPILNIIAFLYLFLKPYETYEKEWLEEFKINA